MNSDADLRAIADATAAHLGDEPVPTEALIAHLRDLGLLVGAADADGAAGTDDAIELLYEAGELAGIDLATTIDDALVYRADRVIDGVVMTHILTPEELEAGWIAHNADVLLLDRALAFDEAVALTGGLGQLELVDDGDAAPGSDDVVLFVDGPEGWLDAYEPGDVLTITQRPDGVELGRLEGRLTDGAAEVEALRGAFDALVAAGHECFEAHTVLLDAIVRTPSAFRAPAPPLGLLLEQLGLEIEAGILGVAGTGFALRRHLRLAAEVAQATFGLEACCRTEFAVVHQAYLDVLVADSDEAAASVAVDAEAVGRALTHSDVARATVFAASADEDADSVSALLRLLEHLRDVEGTPRAGACFTMSLLTERAGDVDTSHALVREALAADASFLAAREQFARDLALAGDLDAAIKVRQQLDLEGDHELEFLRTLRPVRRAMAGRNDPCPCGSGKKYKACCIDKPAALDPTTHATWLQHKLALFVYRPEHEPLLEELIDAALGEIDDESTLEDHEQFLVESGVLGNWLAFDGGAAGTFLERYGAALPEVEREMLDDWVARPTSLYRIAAGRRAGEAALRDLRSGEQVDVRDPDGALARRDGAVVLARLGRVGDEHLALGVPLTVPASLVDDALVVLGEEPDAVDVAQWYGVMAEVANASIGA